MKRLSERIMLVGIGVGKRIGPTVPCVGLCATGEKSNGGQGGVL